MKYSDVLSFVDGTLTIKRAGYGDEDGNGHLAFADSDLEWEYPDCSSGARRWITLDKSELIAIRDFLNRLLPVEPTDVDG